MAKSSLRSNPSGPIAFKVLPNIARVDRARQAWRTIPTSFRSLPGSRCIAVFHLAPDGTVVRPLPAFATDAALIPLYRAMTLSRIFDAKAMALQRTGQLGTYRFPSGQEAIGVGYASAMRRT